MANSDQTSGPIRHGAVIPATILFVVCFVLFKFFLDVGIKRAIEWAGTQTTGAEVDVGSVHTSLIGGSFTLNNLQLTDKQDPSRNTLQIGQMRFALSWDALLRLKFVIKDAGVDSIALYAPRKSAGWVKPPEPPKPPAADGKAEPSTLDSIQDKVTQQVKGAGAQDPLGGVSKLLAGTSQGDLLKNLKGGLKSEAKIKELQAEIKEKQAAWKERIAKLPQKKEFDDLVVQAKSLKFDLKNPKEFAESAKKAKEIKETADKKFREIKDTTDALKADADHLNAQYKEIDTLVKEDINSVQSGLNLSDLNAKELSRAMFANLISQKLGAYAKYLALAEKYMAGSKKQKDENQDLMPHKRGAGKNYRFPVTTGYPLFWLQKATISSKSTNDGFSGNIDGSLTNLTSDPHVVQKPAILDVHGDFPKTNVMNTHLKLTLDHVNEPKDSLEMEVGSFPVAAMSLADSGDVHLAIQQASGQSSVKAVYQNAAVNVDMNNAFQDVKYDVKASGVVKEALDSVLSGIPKVTVQATATGSLSNLNLSVDSNLGTELSKGLQKYVQGKIDAVKKQIQDQIQEKINGPKKELSDQISKAKGENDSVLNSQKQQADQAQKQILGSTKSGSSGGSLQDQIKDRGQQLLKGLHF